MVLCSLREIVSLKFKIILAGLQFITADQMSLVSPPISNGQTIQAEQILIRTSFYKTELTQNGIVMGLLGPGEHLVWKMEGKVAIL